MAIFGLKDERAKREKALAKALAKRGVAGEAAVESMRETGETRGGVAKEVEFELSFTDAAGERHRVNLRQFMNDLALTGIAPGKPAEILYDRDDPAQLIVRKSPKYAIVDSSSGPVAVPVAEAGAAGVEGS
jgi:hypothetical protein